ITERLDTARTLTLDMEEVFVVAAVGGRVLASTDRNRVGDYRTSELFFMRGREGTFIQNVYPSPLTGRPTMTVATPLRGPDGRVVAVLAGNLNLTQIDHFLAARSGLGTRGEAYLVRRLSDFVSASHFGRPEARRGIHTEGVWHALSGRNGAGVYDNYADVRVLGVYRWIASRELALMVEMHAAE